MSTTFLLSSTLFFLVYVVAFVLAKPTNYDLTVQVRPGALDEYFIPDVKEGDEIFLEWDVSTNTVSVRLGYRSSSLTASVSVNHSVFRTINASDVTSIRSKNMNENRER